MTTLVTYSCAIHRTPVLEDIGGTHETRRFLSRLYEVSVLRSWDWSLGKLINCKQPLSNLEA